ATYAALLQQHSFPTRRPSDLWSTTATQSGCQNCATALGPQARNCAGSARGSPSANERPLRTTCHHEAEEPRSSPSPRHSGRCSRSEEHTSELQSRGHLVCRLL